MRLASTLVEVKFNDQVAYKVFFAFVLIYELPITMIALTFEEFSTLSFWTLSSKFLRFMESTWDYWGYAGRICGHLVAILPAVRGLV